MTRDNGPRKNMQLDADGNRHEWEHPARMNVPYICRMSWLLWRRPTHFDVFVEHMREPGSNPRRLAIYTA